MEFTFTNESNEDRLEVWTQINPDDGEVCINIYENGVQTGYTLERQQAINLALTILSQALPRPEPLPDELLRNLPLGGHIGPTA